MDVEIVSAGETAAREFSELVNCLHDRNSKQKITGMFKAYLDESADGKKEKIFLIASWVGSLDAWAKFIPEWVGELDRAGIRCFHMTDCMARKDAFKNFSIDDTERLVLRLVEVIKCADIRGFWYAMVMKDYNELISNNQTAKKVACLNDPHCMTFGSCVQEIAVSMESYPPVEKVMFIFDNLTKLRARTIEYYGEVTKLYEERVHHTMAISPKEKVIPLQAVDFLAWEMRRDLENSLGLSRYDSREELTAIKHKLANGCGYLDKGHLEKLSNWLAAQKPKPSSDFSA